MNDDRTLLASRYLDGDLTPDERDVVEGDAELLAEVERMRSVREALAAVPAPSVATRDAAVAAALAAARTLAAPPVAALTARRRARWLVPAAAALVGVLALGGLASLFAGTGDDDDDSASMELTAATGAVTETADGDEAGGEDAAVTAAERTAAGTVEAEERATAADDGQSTATIAAGAAGTAPSGAIRTSGARLSTPEDLRDFARGEPPEESLAEPATTQSDDADLADLADLAALAQRCALGDLVGTAYYVVDGTDEFVLVVTDADEAFAVTPTCAVVARAPLR